MADKKILPEVSSPSRFNPEHPSLSSRLSSTPFCIAIILYYTLALFYPGQPKHARETQNHTHEDGTLFLFFLFFVFFFFFSFFSLFLSGVRPP